MAITSMTVDVTGRDVEEQQTLWLGLVAFGKAAERLSRCVRVILPPVHGKFTQKPYTAKGGGELDGYSLLVESIISHRPKVGKKRTEIPGKAAPDDFCDDIPDAFS